MLGLSSSAYRYFFAVRVLYAKNLWFLVFFYKCNLYKMIRTRVYRWDRRRPRSWAVSCTLASWRRPRSPASWKTSGQDLFIIVDSRQIGVFLFCFSFFMGLFLVTVTCVHRNFFQFSTPFFYFSFYFLTIQNFRNSKVKQILIFCLKYRPSATSSIIVMLFNVHVYIAVFAG